MAHIELKQRAIVTSHEGVQLAALDPEPSNEAGRLTGFTLANQLFKQPFQRASLLSMLFRVALLQFFQIHELPAHSRQICCV